MPTTQAVSTAPCGAQWPSTSGAADAAPAAGLTLPLPSVVDMLASAPTRSFWTTQTAESVNGVHKPQNFFELLVY
jgi:hypothetical protein